MSLAAFDKHLRPVGSHIGYEKNSFAAYRLTFWPLFSTVRDGGRLLHNSGRQIPFVFFLSLWNFTSTLSPPAIEMAPPGCSCRLLFAKYSKLSLPTECWAPAPAAGGRPRPLSLWLCSFVFRRRVRNFLHKLQTALGAVNCF